MKNFFVKNPIIIPGLFFVANIAIQNYNLGRFLDVISDEGVYLYAAKLMSHGFVPYRDFFLAHPPMLMLAIAGFFKLTNTNINLFHLTYSIWVFTALFPLYFLAEKISNSKLAAALSLFLFSTYQGLALLNAREFTLRVSALPLLAFALYFIYVKNRDWIAAIFLALFAMTTVSDLLLTGIFIFLLVVFDFINGERNIIGLAKKYLRLVLIFALIVLIYYGATLLVPEAFRDIVSFQTTRSYISLQGRFMILGEDIAENWPYYVFGFIGSLILPKRYRAIGAWTIVGFLVTSFASDSFYAHYLNILTAGFAIGSVGCVMRMSEPKIRYVFCALVVLAVCIVSGPSLKYSLIDRTTPDFYNATEFISKQPGPLFAVEPMYSLVSGKPLVFSYYVADMRAFATLNLKMSSPQYRPLFDQSKTILIGPFPTLAIDAKSKQYVAQKFQLIYQDDTHKIYHNKG